MSALLQDKINVEEIRQEFPVLHQKINNYPLIYFDNAASSQKPLSVINAISDYYKKHHSNVHRGVHHLSARATDMFEEARLTVAKFINAPSDKQVIFTRGTTESVNLVAFSFGEKFIGEGDEIILSEMEHHSNIVPWQLMAERKKAHIKVIPVTDSGELDLEAYKNLFSDRTKIVSVAHVSNALGTVNPVKEIIDEAHKHNVPVLLDGAQASPHCSIDVQQLDCDFYAFSAHKMYGPTGIGVLYGKEKWLEEMPPYQGGGEMIDKVTFQKTTFNDLPFKFEAGTPHIAGAVGLKAAIDFMMKIGVENIASHETDLLKHATSQLCQIEGFNIVGTAKEKTGVISFLLNNAHPYDVGVLLDNMGIAVRTGHHCTEPLMQRFGIPGTARASFAVYNTKQEVDFFVEAVKKIKNML